MLIIIIASIGIVTDANWQVMNTSNKNCNFFLKHLWMQLRYNFGLVFIVNGL